MHTNKGGKGCENGLKRGGGVGTGRPDVSVVGAGTQFHFCATEVKDAVLSFSCTTQGPRVPKAASEEKQEKS